MSDKDLENKIQTFRELGKENPNVNVNLLMMNALETESENKISAKSYKWPYLISVGAPPFGLIYVFKYYFSSDENDQRAAKICLFLTIISVIAFFAFSKALFSSSGTSLQQIEQIKPSDIQQLNQ
ncbi:MAG: hypothetical protein M1400_03165 [Patescibacteria group bacterium]|nr:hypothetical protein [Patescibacteria group bacterium]